MNETPLFRRRRASLLALLVAVFLAFSCGPKDEPAPASATSAAPDATAADQTPRQGGTIVAGTIADMDTVNEALSSGTRATDDILFLMYLHLLDEQPDFKEHPPTFAPELAESYSFSDDHLELTFHLRHNVKWSDGEPVTADDVRFTWQAHMNPSVAYSQAYLKENIQDVEVVDPYTVVFHYSKVSPYQLNAAVEGVILPKHSWSKLPFDQWRSNAEFFRDNLVVDGPFTLDRWVPQQEVALRRNPSYFDAGKPYLDGIVFRQIPEKANQITQLLSGDLDFVEQIPVTDVDRLEKAPGTSVQAFWHRLYTYVAWNLDSPLFAEASVRRALTMAIDRNLIIETLWGRYARLAVSPIVHDVWAFDSSIEPWPYDPERARQILADAGWKDTDGDGILDRDGKPFSFDLITNQGNQPRIDATVMMQEQLRRVGVDARPRVVEFNAMMSSMLDRHFDAGFSAWGMPTSLDMRYAFHTSEIGGGGNFSGYSNPEVDRLVERMEGLPEIIDAKPILLRLQEILHQDQPMTFVWESQRINGMNARLRGVEPNVLGSFRGSQSWWLAPAEE